MQTTSFVYNSFSVHVLICTNVKDNHYRDDHYDYLTRTLAYNPFKFRFVKRFKRAANHRQKKWLSKGREPWRINTILSPLRAITGTRAAWH